MNPGLVLASPENTCTLVRTAPDSGPAAGGPSAGLTMEGAGTPVVGSELTGLSMGGSRDVMMSRMVAFEVVVPLVDPMGLLRPLTATVANP